MKLRKRLTTLFTTAILCGSLLMQPMTAYAEIVSGDDIDVIGSDIFDENGSSELLIFDDISAAADTLSGLKSDNGSDADDFDIGNNVTAWRGVFGVDSYNVSNDTAYSMFCRAVGNIKCNANGSDYVDVVKLMNYGTQDITYYREQVLNTVAAGNEENLVGMYAVANASRETSGTNTATGSFTGCDYNIITEKFVYYYIGAVAVSNKADNLMVVVFTTKEFLWPSESLHEWDDNDWSLNTDLSDETKDNVKENLPAVVESLLLYNGEPIIKYIVDNPTSFSSNSTVMGKLKAVDTLLSMEAKTGEEDAYTIKLIASHKFEQYHGGAESADDWNENYNIIEAKTYAENARKIIHQQDIVFDDNYVLFGESGSLATPGDVGDDLFSTIVAGLINDTALAYGSDTDTSVVELLSYLDGKSTFIYSVLSAYSDKLQACIDKQNLNPITEDNLKECSSTDYYGIVHTALGLQLQLVSDNMYTPGALYELQSADYYLKLTDNLEDISNDVKQDVDGSTYTIMSVGYAYSKLDDFQKASLHTAYINKASALGVQQSRYITGWGSSGIFSTEAAGRIVTHDNMPTIEIMQERIAKYEESGLTLTGNLLNVARCSNILGQYSIMSSLYTNSSDISSIYQIYNANLDSLLSEVWDYGSIEDEPFIMLPKRIGIFGNESADYVGLLEKEDNWNRFVCMLYNVSYAFEVCAWSELGEEEGFTPEDIKNMFSGNYQGSQDDAWVKFLCSNQTSNLKDVNTVDAILSTADPEVISMLRSVCELGKLCDFLGIKEGDWSPTIDAYLEIWHDPNYKEFWTAVQASKWVYATAEEGAISVEEPLGMFFNIDEREMTDQWVSGFALSALHVPMETNLYDASSVTFLNNPDWVSEFFYRYGFNRKALYINTDNAAIVNQFVSGQTSGTRPATLSDLINYDRDIILTVDDNFYNADEINTVISRLDYTSIKNSNNEDTEETGNNLSITENLIGGMLDLDAEHILKTGPNMYYSEKLATKVTKLGDDEGKGLIDYDAYVLSSKEILGADGYDSVIESYEYSVKQSYGVVSAIYRSESLYNECLRAIVSDNAVFKSSKAICSTPGTTSTQWRCVYNYYMLANLEEQMKNDSASTLDLDAPIFIDIFGNIVTESGLVIIPAACNATLCGENWTPYTVGWSEYYNNGVHMTTEDFNEDVYEWLIGQDFAAISSGPQDWTDVQNVSKVNAGGYFWIEGDELKLRTSEIQSGNLTGTVQWEYVNKNSTVVKQLFYNDAYFQKGMNMYSHTITNLIVEVMRGAPIEYIDYGYEDLDNSRDISKYGVYIAYKLEELYENMMGSSDDALGGNSVVTQPNLAFVSGLEYIYLYIFKIVFAVCVVALAIHLYLDVVKGHIGLKSVGSFLMTVVLTVVAITLVPKLNTWTYYQANRDFLREEAGQLLMLNYVKEYDGAEIGITKVTTPETDTKLYLKVADADVPWYSIIPEVLFGDTNASLTELYENHLKKDPMALTPGVQLKGDGLYVDIQDILDSSEITFAPASNVLQHYTRKGQATTVLYDIEYETKDEDGNIVKEKMQETINIGTDCTSVVSFTLPYYVFLEQLVASVNEYNVSRDVAAYSWSVGNNGHVLTYDLLTPYLTSSEFLDEGYDILGLDRILKTGNNRVNYSYPFDTAELNKMEHASWYHEEVDETMTRDKIDKVYQYARDFVRDNQDVLGKVPDEVFLKTLAMQCAIAYNKEFGVPNGNAIEIIDIDTRDLIRFMLSDYSDIYKNYSYSFTRNTYEQAGAIGVILAGLLLVIYWLGGFLKIALQFTLLGLLVINVLGRKLLFRKESRCIEGYLIGCGCLCLVNYAYAIMLKVTMSVANMGFGAVMALLVGMIAQVLYIVALVGILFIEIKDWKNSGYEEFAKMGHMVVSGALSFGDMVRDKTLSKFNSAYGDSARNRKYTGGDVDSSYIDEMLERDAEREENAFSNSV